MTATEAARQGWCVGPTTVSSSVPTSIPRTTAVNTLTAVEAGASGEASAPAARAVVWGAGPGTGSARVPAVLTPLSLSRDFVTLSPAYNYLQLWCSTGLKYKSITTSYFDLESHRDIILDYYGAHNLYHILWFLLWDDFILVENTENTGRSPD